MQKNKTKHEQAMRWEKSSRKKHSKTWNFDHGALTLYTYSFCLTYFLKEIQITSGFEPYSRTLEKERGTEVLHWRVLRCYKNLQQLNEIHGYISKLLHSLLNVHCGKLCTRTLTYTPIDMDKEHTPTPKNKETIIDECKVVKS